jgi:tetratricopeptide (TPR) repeat protein
MPSMSRQADPQYAAAVAAIQAGRFGDGAALMKAYVDRDEAAANDADAQNWLGYAYRKSGDLDAAFLHYDKALAINPKHRGAHEYLGEAYLMTGNLARAEEHLKILDQLCWLPCTEYTQLKTAVADYKAAHPETVGSR